MNLQKVQTDFGSEIIFFISSLKVFGEALFFSNLYVYK